MTSKLLLAAPALLLGAAAALSRPAPLSLAQCGVGDLLPPVELEDFTLTEAKSFDDYLGRTVLVEFFAYW